MPRKVLQIENSGDIYLAEQPTFFEKARAFLGSKKEMGELNSPTFITSIESGLSVTNRKPRTRNVWDAYKRVPTLRKCINATGYFCVRRGYELKVEGIKGEPRKKFEEYCREQNRRVNIEHISYLTVVKKHIWGRTGWEIVDGNGKNIDKLQSLYSQKIIPNVDKATLDIESFQYGSVTYKPDEILYFVQDPILDPKGFSSVETLRVHCDAKLEYEFDLLQAAKRHWAPTGVYTLDTAAVRDPQTREQKVRDFKQQLQPGRSVVTNQKVDAQVIKLTPDLQGIIRSIERQDEEIMGAFQMPKAIMAREKTLTRATLEFSLKALYEGPIAFEQQQLSRDLEDQWYGHLAKRFFGEEQAEKINVQHVWRMYTTLDPALIRALSYAVANNAMTRKEMFWILGIEMLDPAELVPRPTRPQPTQELPNQPNEDLIQDGINEINEKLTQLIETNEQEQQHVQLPEVPA